MKLPAKTWLWLAITLLFMSFIFYKSAEPYKKQDIKPYLRQHLQLTEANVPKVDSYYDGEHVSSKSPYDLVEFFIRKSGHISEYALLCFLWLMTLRSAKINIIWSLTIAGLASLLYAGTDEWHQTFVSGRTGHPIDVFGPDLLGIVLTLFLYTMISMFWQQAIKR